MSDFQFEFKPQKAIEAILYVANRTKDTPTFLRVVKLLYLADKTSLEKYGRFIFGDTYHAMQHGPVPTNTYDLLKSSESSEAFDVHQNQSGHPTISPKRQADINLLSESDTECLDQVLEAYDIFPTWSLRQISHDEAWETTWKERETESPVIPLSLIINQLDNCDELLDYLQNLNS